MGPRLLRAIANTLAVFAVLSGWVVLGEALSVKELFGCVLVFVAVLLAQVQFPCPKRKRE